MAETSEQNAAKLLLLEGVLIVIGKHTYRIKEMSFGMLDAITALRLRMTLDENALREDPLGGANKVIQANIHYGAKIVAIAILGWSPLKRRIFSPILAWWLKGKLTPSKLLEATSAIIQMTNATDFLNSIRLLHGIQTTAPKIPDPIEKKSKAPLVKEEPSLKSSAGPTTT